MAVMIARALSSRTPQAAAGAILVCVCCLTSAFAQSDSTRLAGRRLEDALRVLQARGLRIVFSSQLVTPDLRVRSEPRAKAAREQLTEILEPHGLAIEAGPGGVLQVVRTPRASETRTERPKADPAKRPAGSAPPVRDPAYHEQVTVTPAVFPSVESAAASRRRVTADTLRTFGGHIADDPLRLVQALPGVASADDFRAEYSVRGSHYRHAGLVVDGIVAPWLQHAAPGRGQGGTLTMLRGDVIGDATLHVGAYPRHDAGLLGPQLSLTLREGTRVAPRLRLGVSGTASSLTAEGPLGSATRGSWLVGIRKSHVEWPVGRSDHDGTVFGYGDVQSKLVYDVAPGQQVGLSVVAGLSNVERDDPDPLALADGINRAALAGLFWRSTLGARAVVTQRVSVTAHEFVDRARGAAPASGGSGGAQAYRADAVAALFGGTLDAGAHVRRAHDERDTPGAAPVDRSDGDVAARAFERSAHASFRRVLPYGVAIVAGARVADSTLARGRVLDRWLEGEWTVATGWLVHGSTGVMHQFPAVHELGSPAGIALEPARATYLDVGIAWRPSTAARWDLTVFTRRERDGLPGVAHGVELTFEGRTASGVSGWAAYSYGVARAMSIDRRETFPADFDQRHALNVAGAAPLPWGARAGVTFRGGSNFPIPGYLTARDGRLFPGDRRNASRLPAYARLDARVERTFGRAAARQLTLFGEVLNVLNRANAGLAPGSIAGGTGHAVAFIERQYPRLLTAGLRIDF